MDNEQKINSLDIINQSISDIKYMTDFIDKSAATITSGNYSHKQSGIRHASYQINKILDDLKCKLERNENTL